MFLLRALFAITTVIFSWSAGAGTDYNSELDDFFTYFKGKNLTSYEPTVHPMVEVQEDLTFGKGVLPALDSFNAHGYIVFQKGQLIKNSDEISSPAFCSLGHSNAVNAQQSVAQKRLSTSAELRIYLRPEQQFFGNIVGGANGFRRQAIFRVLRPEPNSVPFDLVCFSAEAPFNKLNQTAFGLKDIIESFGTKAVVTVR